MRFLFLFYSLSVAFLVVEAQPAFAGPVTFSSALPVSSGMGIFRGQLKVMQKTGDSTAMNRRVSVSVLPSIFVYGVDEKLTLFAALPYFEKRLKLNNGGMPLLRSASGFGDAKVFARYTTLAINKQGSTLRLSPYIGLKLPTGEYKKRDAYGLLPQDLQPGSGSWDPFFGISLSWQTLDWELDASTDYTSKQEANHFQYGDEAKLNASFQYRILPRELDYGVPGFLYAVIESNLIWNGTNRNSGIIDRNSGGTTLNIVPGLQYVTRRFVFETVVQIPAIQNLNGTALQSDWTITAGFRFNF